MSENRRKYSREFKVDAMGLVTKQGYTVRQAAESLGIRENMLWRWKKQLQDEDAAAFKPGEGPGAEVKQLREENRRLKLERDILKKATAFFAKESQ
ncbi:MAG: transposase [Candidatus Hinthialibacter antarcticus]|nr:transposase [Candidatus Hinthialibacter antarcticus]